MKNEHKNVYTPELLLSAALKVSYSVAFIIFSLTYIFMVVI